MKTSSWILWLKVLGLLLAGLCFGGCENRLTRENYDKIQVGMTVEEVVAILGPGEKMVDGAGSKLAKDMISDITMAQQRQNQNQTKQGLSDLVKDRDAQTQREAEGGKQPAKPAAPRASAAPATNSANARVPAPPTPQPTRAPIRDRWIWKSDRIEITVDFSDDRVTTKNQDGL